jgi:hypothetical protein
MSMAFLTAAVGVFTNSHQQDVYDLLLTPLTKINFTGTR